jgi:DNA repair exonuclease SbcCD ATPase subunit
MQVILIIASGFWLFVGFILGLWHKDKQIQKEIDHWKNEATSTGFFLDNARSNYMEARENAKNAKADLAEAVEDLREVERQRDELEKENKRLRDWAEDIIETCPLNVQDMPF